MSNRAAARSRGRAKRRKPLIVRSRRRLSLTMMSRRRRSCCPAASDPESSCTEPEIAASGFPTSCARPAASSPTAAMRSLSRSSSCKPAPLGEILEDDDPPGRDVVGVGQPGDGESDRQVLFATLHHELRARSPIEARRRCCGAPLLFGEQPALGDRPAQKGGFAGVQDLESSAVHGGHPGLEVGRDQAAGDRLDHVAVKDLEVGEAAGLLGELLLGPGRALDEVGGQQRHGIEAEQVDRQVVGDPEGELEVGGQHREGRQPVPRQGGQERGVEDVGEPGDGEGGAPLQDDAPTP